MQSFEPKMCLQPYFLHYWCALKAFLPMFIPSTNIYQLLAPFINFYTTFTTFYQLYTTFYWSKMVLFLFFILSHALLQPSCISLDDMLQVLFVYLFFTYLALPISVTLSLKYNMNNSFRIITIWIIIINYRLEGIVKFR